MEQDIGATDERRPDFGPQRGRNLLHTISDTRYVIDIELMVLTHIPAENDDRYDDHLAPSSLPLRPAHQRLKVLRLHQLAVGEKAIFDLEPLGDPRHVTFTRRSSTEVLSIDVLESGRLDLRGDAS
jgi:hypothetical protein